MTTNTNLEQAKILVASAEKLLADAKAQLAAVTAPQFPTEPVRDPWGKQTEVISFTKFFGRANTKGYTYLALRPTTNTNSLWYITGRSIGDPGTGMTWESLIKFIAKDEAGQLQRVINSMTTWGKEKTLVYQP